MQLKEAYDIDLSIVVPVFNEKENIRDLCHGISEAMIKLSGKTYEIIIVDDGSTDGTYEVLKELKYQNAHLKVIKFRRNFGQTAAMKAGFDYSRGKVIVTMDGDLQNDPSDISLLLDKIDEGFDIVSGWRYHRKDPFLKRRLPSMIANKIISMTTKVKLHDYGCSLKAFKNEVAKNIALYGEMHRFIPALASWMGVSVAEVKVNHLPRTKGSSKYGISRTLRVVLDLITVKFLLSFSTKPIQVFGFLGLVSGFLGFAIGLYLSVARLVFGQPIAGRPMLLMAVFLMFLGVQFITMGLLAEIQIRTYHEAQNKPIYVIKEIME
ncbi:MAG: glycosyltransferase family 2 protein [Candidatus Theseobacter exili]|nr:glycosyltransferase family 2 protein [Candidatus Theseobacter exili]